MVCTSDVGKGTDCDFVYYVKMIGTDKKPIEAHVKSVSLGEDFSACQS